MEKESGRTYDGVLVMVGVIAWVIGFMLMLSGHWIIGFLLMCFGAHTWKDGGWEDGRGGEKIR